MYVRLIVATYTIDTSNNALNRSTQRPRGPNNTSIPLLHPPSRSKNHIISPSLQHLLSILFTTAPLDRLLIFLFFPLFALTSNLLL